MKKEMNSQTTLLEQLIALCDEDKDGEPMPRAYVKEFCLVGYFEALLEVRGPASSIQPMHMTENNDAHELPE